MIPLTIKNKIIIFAVILVFLIFVPLITSLESLHQVHLAKHKAIIADHIRDSFDELRIMFEKILMGPHDYLITYTKEEKNNFKTDINHLEAKIDLIHKMIIDSKQQYGLDFDNILQKAESRILAIENNLPELELKVHDIFALHLPEEIHKGGLYMEKLDLFVRGLEENIKQETFVLSALMQQAMKRIESVHTRVQLMMLIVGIFAVAIGTILSYLMIKSIITPLDNLIKTSRKIQDGNLTERANITTHDELGELASSFNEMVTELVATQECVTTIFQGTGDAMRVIDTDFNIIRMNKKMEAITGKSAQESREKKCYDVFFGELCQTKNCTLKRILDGRNLIEIETTKQTGTGKKIAVELIATPFKRKGKPIGIIESFRDISKRKQAEEELLKARKIESVGILAGGLAHDFNNLLTSILGNISMAKDELKPGDEAFELLTEAENSSLLARDLTHQLITFSKGGAPVKKIGLISDIIKKSVDFASITSNITCTLNIDSDLWPVEFDEGQISQVIFNIMNNAVYAMPEGGTIEVVAENFINREKRSKENLPLQEGKYIKISIKDQGAGISEENLFKIFDPYFSTKQKGSKKGTGLGLAICYSIITKHNGCITVDSEVGVGTTFNIYLPAAPLSMRAAPTA